MTKKCEKARTVMDPVDYLIVRFPKNKFRGEIATELASLEKNGIIRLIDLVFVLKDENGAVLITEAKNLGGQPGDAFRAFTKTTGEWFSLGDIETLAAGLPRNSSAGIL